jgi:hypothetical protein
MTYFSDLPLPDLTVREGDADPIDFTLKQADGTTPVNLTGRIVELRLRALRGEQTTLIFRTDATTLGPLAIVITTPTLGGIQFTNPTSPPSAGLLALSERYRGYFAIYETLTPVTLPKTIPQPRDFWVAMLPRLA